MEPNTPAEVGKFIVADTDKRRKVCNSPISSRNILNSVSPENNHPGSDMPLSRCKLLHLAAGVGTRGAYPMFRLRRRLSESAGHHDRAFRRRRRNRHLGADALRSDGKSLGQTVIVEDLAGAAGAIGVAKVVHSPRRLHAVHRHLTTHVLIGGLYKLDFDRAQRFDADRRARLRAASDLRQERLPVKDLKELIAWLKEIPAKPASGFPAPDRPAISPAFRSRKRPGPRSSSCPIAATVRRCKT